MEVFWRRDAVSEEGQTRDEPTHVQFVIEDDEDDDDEHDEPLPGSSQKPPPKTAAVKKTLPSLAERLEKGVGSTTEPGPSQTFESNRTEVLRTLLVLFSKQIYAPPTGLFTSPSLYTLHFVQHTPRRDVLTLLCSLMNTAMNALSSHNLIGGVAGKLPYNHLVFKGEDTKANLVGICLQVLCVLLDFQSGSARDLPGNDGDSSSPTAKTNAFRYFIAKLVGLCALLSIYD
ncbi:hypothetical protein EIP86_002255 [Pleurotus ostreatoroseus]|nr:hypothetical protein EIP86_002255 [Pleurotus ostreatoroseus]